MSFAKVQQKIAGQGHSMKAAGAILAASTRRASPAAKRNNPALKKVLPAKHPKAGGTPGFHPSGIGTTVKRDKENPVTMPSSFDSTTVKA